MKKIVYNNIEYKIDEKTYDIYLGDQKLPQINLSEYVYVTQPKLTPVHRIIASAYCEIPDGYDISQLQVDHIDNNPRNNKPSNLKWRTRKQNNSRLHSCRLKSKNAKTTNHKNEKLEIFDKKTGEKLYFKNYNVAAAYYGVTRQAVIHWCKPRGRNAIKFGNWIIEK